MKQSGNALFLILIAVALFAALSYAITQSSRGGGGIDRERLLLDAAAIVEYGAEFQNAATRMRLINGCGDTQFTFEDHNDVMTTAGGTPYDFTNVNAPSDGSCSFFSPEGGGISPRLLPKGATVDPSLVASGISHPQATLLIGAIMQGHSGDADPGGVDLAIRTGRLTRAACIEINNKLGIENPNGLPPADVMTSCGVFTGAFDSCVHNNPLGDEVPALQGKGAFCVENNSAQGGSNNTGYHFIHVILPR